MSREHEILTGDEIARFTKRSDLLGLVVVASEWLIIATIFAGVAWWTNPLTVLLGIILLGGRQLGLAVIVHECGHRSLFRSAYLNRFCGNWLAAYPVLSDMDAYMRKHLQHHRLAGTADDPDLLNYRDYPVSNASLKRKIIRDLTAQTGWKALKGIYYRLQASRRPAARQSVRRGIAVNFMLFAVLLGVGEGWLYLLWATAFLTTFQLFSRVRQVAEHAMVPDPLSRDPRKNTRTTHANFLERLTIAPNRVNYHLEHHILASAPMYRLRSLHRYLCAKGAYQGVDFPRGYVALLRKATHSAR